jgi:hypothetical protein
MKSHAAAAAADVMAAVEISRGTIRQSEVEVQTPPPLPMHAYSSFRQSLDGEILKDMLLPHMRSLHKVFSQVLLAVADVVEGIDDFDALWSCHGTAVFLSSLRCFVHQGRKGYPIMQLMCNICAGLVDGIHLK